MLKLIQVLGYINYKNDTKYTSEKQQICIQYCTEFVTLAMLRIFQPQNNTFIFL